MTTTFVIPTIGRDTLKEALGSLIGQTDRRWDAVIVCDGWMRIDEGPEDERIEWFGAQFGSAGLARNVGIELAKGDWIAFLDDDDVVMPTYVAHLNEHVEDYPWAEVVIFRMDHPDYGVLPRPDGHLRLGTVGISFALRCDVANFYKFVAEETHRGFHEDWDLISRLMSDERRIFLSPHVEYVVHDYHSR